MRHILLSAAFLAAIAPVAASADTLDLPARKPGLWQMTMTFESRQMPPVVSEQCVDAETDRMMQTMGTQMSKDMCSQQSIKKSGDAIVIDSVCNLGGGTSTSHSVMTGDFSNAYTVKVDTKHEGGGAMMAPGAMRMSIAAKWAGPCKADQKPGDIMMGQGMKMNVRDLQKMQPPKR